MTSITLALLALPALSLAATVNLNVQAVVSGTLGSTALNRVQVRIGLIVDNALITGAVGSQSTPAVSGSATYVTVGAGSSAVPLTSPLRITVSGGTLSLAQDGNSAVSVSNSAIASADLRSANPINLEGSPSSGPLTFATAAGQLSLVAGARFSFHNAVRPPGGGGTETYTITSKTAYNVTSTTRDVETFQTRLAGRLNGAPVYDQTFSKAFSDPAVQAAVAQARAAISTAASGGVVNFTGPTRTSTARSISNSTQQTVDGVPSDAQVVTVTWGPAFLYVGDDEAQTFFVARGDTNYDLLTTHTIPRTITTTNTYLTSETYSLDGTTSAPPTGLRFVSVTPCRLIETRPEYNFQGRAVPFGPPFLNAAETRTFVPQLSTVCTVPNSAKAYVFNVTLIPRGPTVDFATVFPAGETRPDYWTVRSPDGLIVANSAIVKAGAGGAVSVYSSHNTDILIDIAGYFTDNPQESNLVYYPLTPCRVIETRAAYRPQTGPFGPPALLARQTRNFRFPQSPDCSIPSGAAAYSVTLTVIPPAALQYLTAWPAGATQPNVSSINSPNGRVLANSVIVPASTNGSISLFPFDDTDAIVDINGYFAPDDGVNGLFYYPVTQCRLSNSTDNTFTGNFGPPIFQDTSTRTIAIPTSRCSSVPSTVKAYALNATVIPNGNPVPFLTVWPSGQPQPNASIINAFQGQTVSSAFIVPAGTNGSVDVYAFRRTHVVLEISGYFGR